MAAQALYRRYRSQTFDELIGQEHIVQTLHHALRDGRVAHAYLFTGPRGVGKTTVARLLAKALSCTAAAAQRPCGQCDACRAVADGRAVDVIEMDAASHTSVEDAREIIERVQFRPTLGSYKVHIIDEVHMLSTAAFNALLKTLEEPPGHAVFILATTEVHRVPETILSRCQRFTFRRHSVDVIAAHLHRVAAAEGFALADGAAVAIGRAATGSMRDALSVLDQLMSYGSSPIALAQVRALLGTSAAAEVGALLDGLLANDAPAALAAIQAVVDEGRDVRQFARELVEQLRALLLLRAGADPTVLELGDEERAALQQRVPRLRMAEGLRWLRLFSELDQQLRISPHGQLPLEIAVLEAILAPPEAPAAARPRAPAEAAATPTLQRAGTRTAAPPPAAPPPAAPPAPPPPAAPVRRHVPVDEPVGRALPALEQRPSPPFADDLQDDVVDDAALTGFALLAARWPAILRDVRVRSKTLQALLNSGVQPMAVRDQRVILQVASKFLLTQFEKPAVRQPVEEIISAVLGMACTIEAVLGSESSRDSAAALREQMRDARTDPLVKAALNIFDADIVGIEPPPERS
ncbi:MAG: DNA polymerase III subunit gamma/tau [Chloroflexi bacterium]|nr:DNA polymerase III subunit gamma/tau [Chloroflexota bacterium]